MQSAPALYLAVALGIVSTMYLRVEPDMKVVVKKWGNSAALRLPASLMDAVSLQIDQAVELRAERGHIVLEPLREQEYDLDSMLAAITPENQHASVDFGTPIGKEMF